MKNINKDLGERHNVFTEEIKKIALSSNDDKRIQQNTCFTGNICTWDEQRSSL